MSDLLGVIFVMFIALVIGLGYGYNAHKDFMLEEKGPQFECLLKAK